MASNAERLLALQFAFQIVTDDRNLDRYGSVALVRGDERFDYTMMLDAFAEMATDLKTAMNAEGGAEDD